MPRLTLAWGAQGGLVQRGYLRPGCSVHNFLKRGVPDHAPSLLERAHLRPLRTRKTRRTISARQPDEAWLAMPNAWFCAHHVDEASSWGYEAGSMRAYVDMIFSPFLLMFSGRRTEAFEEVEDGLSVR